MREIGGRMGYGCREVRIETLLVGALSFFLSFFLSFLLSLQSTQKSKIVL